MNPIAGEMLSAAQPLLEQNIHPTVIVRAYYKALESILKHCEDIATPIDIEDKEQVMKLLKSAIGTKFSARFGDLIVCLTRRSGRFNSATLRTTRSS